MPKSNAPYPAGPRSPLRQRRCGGGSPGGPLKIVAGWRGCRRGGFAVLGQAIHHLLQRLDAGRRYHAGLAHTPAQAFAHVARSRYTGPTAAQQRVHRRTQSFGHAEHHRVHVPGVVLHIHPQRRGRTENPRPVDVDLQSVFTGGGSQGFYLCWRPGRPAAAVVSVLYAHRKGRADPVLAAAYPA